MAKSIMIQGTTSNAGKSLITAGLCRIFHQDGYKAAPFKSQNMALNSFITNDGFEMGRAQVMQAEAAKIKPDVRMNPILLKPTSDKGSQVIVNGEVRGNMTARDYFRHKTQLIPDVMKAYNSLCEEYDILVLEGAGQPRGDQFKSPGYCEYGDGPDGRRTGAAGGGYRPGRSIRRPLRHLDAAGTSRKTDGKGNGNQQVPGRCGDIETRSPDAGRADPSTSIGRGTLPASPFGRRG